MLAFRHGIVIVIAVDARVVVIDRRFHCCTVHACTEYIFCTARPHCKVSVRPVTSSSHGKSARGRVLYSAASRRVRG